MLSKSHKAKQHKQGGNTIALKTPWRRRLLSLICVILIFSTVLSVPAFADNVTITTQDGMYSYFQTFSSSGNWTPIMTPAHFISGTGDIAFCLQPAKQSPYGSSYYSINGTDYYDDVTLKGLQAILEHGYPNDWGGFDEEGAWYATANAIRFWLAERGADGSLFWMDLTQYRQFFSDRYPYEDLWFWCLDLVQYARDQEVTPHSVSFSPAELTLEQQGDYFMGETTVSTTNCSGGYTLDTSALPSGSTVTGFTGRNGDTLTIKVPSEYAEESYTLSAKGKDNHTGANLLFYAPNNYQQQRVVTYNVSIFSEAAIGSMKVNTPESAIKTGSITVSKVDAATGEALPSVHFILLNAVGDQAGGGNTNDEGKVSFTDLPLGDYLLKETATIDGYVLDDTEVPVTISENGQTVEITRENSPISGSLEIIKKDAYEDIRLSGAGFRIYTIDGKPAGEGFTDENGILTFDDLPCGDYYYREFQAPMGYVADESTYAFSIEEHDVTVTRTQLNFRREGTLQVKKQDSDGSVLPGAAFLLEFSADGGSTWKPVFAREDDGNVTCGGCTSPGLADGELVSGTDGIAEFVEPGYLPYEKEINGLEEMQAVVGGLIEPIYPYKDSVALVGNDEALLIGLPFNRSVPAGYGGLFGTFFICGLGEDDFVSLTAEQVKFFKNEFKNAEVLLGVRGDNDLVTIKFPAKEKPAEQPEHRKNEPER